MELLRPLFNRAGLGFFRKYGVETGSGIFQKYDDVSVVDFERCMATNTTGLLIEAQAVCPRMIARGLGVIGISGATASIRGKPVLSAFAPAKATQKMLAETLARDLGPQNIHVFYAVVDGVIKADTKNNRFMDPEDIADTYWGLANQKKSAWTFELDLRSFSER